MPNQTKYPEGIPHMDELALRLQISPVKEPYEGVVLFGSSGRAYSMVELLYNLTTFVAQALQYMVAIAERKQEVEQNDESNQGARQPKEVNNPTGDPKSN